mgnify:FL=1
MPRGLRRWGRRRGRRLVRYARRPCLSCRSRRRSRLRRTLRRLSGWPSRRLLCRCCSRVRPLQGFDSCLEGQPLRPQHPCRGALTIANNCGQDDRAIHLAPPALPCCRGCVLDDANKLWRCSGFSTGLARQPLFIPRKEGGNIRIEAIEIHRAGLEHCASIPVAGQGEQKVLERDDAVRSTSRIIVRTRERCRQAA